MDPGSHWFLGVIPLTISHKLTMSFMPLLLQDDASVKPPKEASVKETSAIRGPFVDGRRVLKPKPPPEVVLTRRSETLKTEIFPTVSSSSTEKQKTDSTTGNDFELDLGLDDTTDSFLSENIKSENTATATALGAASSEEKETTEEAVAASTVTTTTTTTTTTTSLAAAITEVALEGTPPLTATAEVKEVKTEKPESQSPSREDSTGAADVDGGRLSPLNGDKGSVGGETISVHTFEKRFNRHERNPPPSRSIPGPSKREMLAKAELPKSSKTAKPMSGESMPAASNPGISLPIASSVPSTHGTLLRAPGMVIPSIPHYRAVPNSTQGPSQNLHPRSHLHPSVMVGQQQFPQNHFFQMYNCK